MNPWCMITMLFYIWNFEKCFKISICFLNVCVCVGLCMCMHWSRYVLRNVPALQCALLVQNKNHYFFHFHLWRVWRSVEHHKVVIVMHDKIWLSRIHLWLLIGRWRLQTERIHLSLAPILLIRGMDFYVFWVFSLLSLKCLFFPITYQTVNKKNV